MTDAEHLTIHLERTFSGDPWHGPALMAILEGVTATEAARRPAPGAHSIWELVRHITAWKREVARRLGRYPAGEPAEGDWPAVDDTSDPAWVAAVADLRAAHAQLLSALVRLSAVELHEPVTDPRDPAVRTGLSRHDTVTGIIDHDVYHAGQIALAKKLVGIGR